MWETQPELNVIFLNTCDGKIGSSEGITYKKERNGNLLLNKIMVYKQKQLAQHRNRQVVDLCFSGGMLWSIHSPQPVDSSWFRCFITNSDAIVSQGHLVFMDYSYLVRMLESFTAGN